MAEKKDDLRGKQLTVEIARIALKIASKARRAKPDELGKLNIAIGLVNHAQGLVNIDDTKAARLLSMTKGIVK